MATVLGVQKTKIDSTPADLAEQGYGGGRVKCISDKYAFTADMAADDIIKMGSTLPKGARIVDARLIATAMSAGTYHVGWAASAALDAGSAVEALDADGIMASVAVTSASSTSAAGSHYTCAWINKVFSAEVQPIITVATDTSAASGTIYLDIYYVVD